MIMTKPLLRTLLLYLFIQIVNVFKRENYYFCNMDDDLLCMPYPFISYTLSNF